ncbi:MAG: preprotein translocase subunit SecA [Deltaproteobacteria bacterium]|nr:preprotein translocase subunit SecA [Deltaproteobacteria bacterium]
MLGYFAKKLFGTRNDRFLKSMRPFVERINELEKSFKSMSDSDLVAQTAKFKERLANGESLDSIAPEAFATVREASVRTLGMRHFDVQLIGGAVLHKGMIAEMKTGEGKTLVATLAAYLNALSGKGVHVVTVNDYLARRDAEWMGRLYNFLGLSVGVIVSGMPEQIKKTAYRSDITYGQNNEFGFDYLRDNMKFTADDLYQRVHNFAIVDEVDSILIDEARTPLIISGPADDATDKYYKINSIIPNLQRETDFEIDLKSKQPTLKEEGVAKVEKLLQIENLYDPGNIELLHHVLQGLRAHTTLERDVDYVVKGGQVIIVDEFTGRLMPGRRWSNGLHQAIEAKEGLVVNRENQTLASITFQNYFRMYQKLSGMTGTADTEAVEFRHIYNLDVVVIPTNVKMVRDDCSDVVFRTKKEKYDAVVRDIEEVHATGQPILVGTISIEQSEGLSKMLKSRGVPHNVLNAKHHEKEAEIVAQAGRFGAVTISTNMAGRGTDIVLGGNPEFLAQAEANTKDREDPAFKDALAKFNKICSEERRKVLDAGGLFIIGTERHESRRIDNQLRGRAGRQGDPGKSRFYISFEDDLMQRFGMDRYQAIMNRMGWEEGVALDGKLISNTIETAQKRVEAYHFESRKHVTEYDDVMNKQRQVVYNLRAKILDNQEIREEILHMVDDLVESAVLAHCDEHKKPMEWDLDSLCERYAFLFNQKLQMPGDIHLEQQSIFDYLRDKAHQLYRQRVSDLGQRLAALEALSSREDSPIAVHISRNGDKPFDLNTVEQDTILETLDHFWNAHLQQMDHLREGIWLRGYGQKNPLYEYQKSGFDLFQQLIDTFKESVVRKLYYYEVPQPEELIAHFEAEQRRRKALEEQMKMIHESAPNADGAAAQPNATVEQAAAPTAIKDPEQERARLIAQRKARRKHKG